MRGVKLKLKYPCLASWAYCVTLSKGESVADDAIAEFVFTLMSVTTSVDSLGSTAFCVNLTSPLGPVSPFAERSDGSSMMLGMLRGVVDLLCGPRIVGASEMRTQFCLLWPLRARGLPFSADGFPVSSSAGSHWNGFPLLLLVDETLVDALEDWRLGNPSFPETSRRTENLLRSAGEPLGDTRERDWRRGVLRARFGWMMETGVDLR